jgi:4-hydroxy-tetrahydrodipicolinate synthase
VPDLIPALETVVAIPVTPFDEAGGLDEKAYATILDRLLDGGIDALTPNGNTGEFYSLTPDELQQLVVLTVERVGDRALVMPGVGHDVATAAAMAAAVAAIGAPAVMVHQPVHPYKSIDGWIAYHQAIAAAAPDLGLVAYVRDPNLTADALARLADSVPALIGVKYAVPDPFGLPAAIAAVGAGRLAWICGLAERWAPFTWIAGARGFTSGLANVAPELSMALLHALRDNRIGDAMALWQQMMPMEQLRARRQDANNVSALKEALAQLGLCGAGVRPPISELEADERAEVTDILRAWQLSPAT